MRRTTRLGAYVASAALALTGTLTGVAPANAAAHDPIGVDQGAAWLEGQLTDGLMYNPNFGGFNDYGLTIDAGLALAAAGGHESTVAQITSALADHVDDYVTPFGGPHSYSGGLAKLASLVGQPAATSFGGQNLVTELEGRVADAAPIDGRLEDAGFTPGDQFDDDSANTLGQAYAAKVLAAADSAEADDVTGFLLQQQCASGYFRLGFTKDKTDPVQSCVEGTDTPDTDATAIAVLQLADQSAEPLVGAAIARAETWLTDQQNDDGSWGGGTSTEAANTNSTGLAAWALGDTAASEKAAQWLRDHQSDDTDFCTALAGDRGAIAYDGAALSTGRTDGIDDASSDQWRRASTQAVPGLTYLPVDTTPSAPSLEAPSGFRKAGSQASLTTSGVNDGDAICLNGRGVRQRQAATGSSVTVPVKLPGGTATRIYTVRDADGHSDTAAVKILGRKKLAVHTSTSRVRRSGKVSVVVRGLQPGERARVLYKGKVKKRGVANSAGKIRTTFRVGRSTGRKRIVAVGQFADIRRGTAVLRVRR